MHCRIGKSLQPYFQDTISKEFQTSILPFTQPDYKGIFPCFLNGAGGLGMLVVASGHPLDTTSTGITGWTGWIVMAVLIAVLVATRRFPVRQPESA